MRMNSFSHNDLSVSRLTALKALLQNLLQAEDTIKVHEARLTEKETTSLDPNEVERYLMTLKVNLIFILRFIFIYLNLI